MHRNRKSTVLALALVAIASGVHIEQADARGGRGGGGGFRGGGGAARAGGARTSVSGASRSYSRPSGGYARTSGGYTRSAGGYTRGYAGGANVQRGAYTSRDVNRNVNRNVNRDVDVHGDYGYYRGGRYYGGYRGYGGYGYGAPVARAAAYGVAAGVTAAAIGSVAYSLPSGCSSLYYSGLGYYNCGGVYYQPQYSGTNVTYVVVQNPQG